MERGKFIVIESGEGAGKTTQINLLANYLEQRGEYTLVTREPGNSPYFNIEDKNILREYMLHGPRGKLPDPIFLAAMMLDRFEHFEGIIRPALKQGTTVITDRCFDSSLVYQVMTGTASRAMYNELKEAAMGGLEPDLIFVLDVEDTTSALKRAGMITGTQLDHVEARGVEYHQEVFDAYRKIAKEPPHVLIPWINRDTPLEGIEERAEIIRKHADKLF